MKSLLSSPDGHVCLCPERRGAAPESVAGRWWLGAVGRRGRCIGRPPQTRAAVEMGQRKEDVNLQGKAPKL